MLLKNRLKVARKPLEYRSKTPDGLYPPLISPDLWQYIDICTIYGLHSDVGHSCAVAVTFVWHFRICVFAFLGARTGNGNGNGNGSGNGNSD